MGEWIKDKHTSKVNPNWRIQKWENYYNMPEQSIDLLFVGSSHCHNGFIPSIFDSITGMCSFNIASSSQSPRTSYHLIKEVLKNHNPQIIVFEIHSYPLSIKDEFENVSFNFDYMNFSIGKYELITSLPLRKQIQLVFPVFRYRDYFYQISNPETIKLDLIFDKGYYTIRSKTKCDNSCEIINEQINRLNKITNINKCQEIYVQKIIDLCSKNNMELYLVTTPFNVAYFDQYTYSKKFVKIFKQIAKNANVSYYDLNVDAYTYLDSCDFKDFDHLNYSGAKKVSAYVADVIKRH